MKCLKAEKFNEEQPDDELQVSGLTLVWQMWNNKEALLKLIGVQSLGSWNVSLRVKNFSF